MKSRKDNNHRRSDRNYGDKHKRHRHYGRSDSHISESPTRLSRNPSRSDNFSRSSNGRTEMDALLPQSNFIDNTQYSWPLQPVNNGHYFDMLHSPFPTYYQSYPNNMSSYQPFLQPQLNLMRNYAAYPHQVPIMGHTTYPSGMNSQFRPERTNHQRPSHTIVSNVPDNVLHVSASSAHTVTNRDSEIEAEDREVSGIETKDLESRGSKTNSKIKKNGYGEELCKKILEEVLPLFHINELIKMKMLAKEKVPNEENVLSNSTNDAENHKKTELDAAGQCK